MSSPQESAALPRITITVLTFNRQALATQLAEKLEQLSYPNLEIIVVDNCSQPPVAPLLASHPRVNVLTMPDNIGIGARNHGMQAATGDYIITLDDDVYGITDAHIHHLIQLFETPRIAGICFKVVDELSGQIIDWCHPYKPEEGADLSFPTQDISEGAVVYRRKALEEVGYYPEEYFISHEGPDLALRLIERGYEVIYTPEVAVRHSRSTLGRASWRRYYFDARNMIWMAIRLYPLGYGLPKVLVSLGALFIYSLRDGFIKYYFKALWDGLLGAPAMWRQRQVISPATVRRLRNIERNKPGLFYLIKKRLFQKAVSI